MGIPKPDKVFYLELSAEEAEKRAVYGKERYEKVAFQQEVEKQFKLLRGTSEEGWQILDASRTVDSLHSQILTESLQVSKAVADLPIAQLWTEELD